MYRLQPARPGARTAQARVLRLLPRESARWRVRVCAHANAGCSLLEATAGTSEHGRAPRERAVSLAQWASIGQGPTPTTRRGARTPHVRVLRPLPRERARAVAFFSCAHAQESYLLEAVAGTSERGRAPRERAVNLAHWAFLEHEPTPTSAARRAHAASARTTSPSETERARWRYFLRTCARKLLVGSRGWHIGARPCTEEEGRLAGTVGFHRAWIDSNQRGAARARHKCACYAFSQERARGGAFACVRTRMPAARCWRPRLARQSTAVLRGRGPSHWRSGLS